PQQRRFSTTGRTHNSRDPSGRNVEANAVQRQQIPLLADKGKSDIRKPYRRQLLSGVHHKRPRITSLQRHAVPSSTSREGRYVRSRGPTLQLGDQLKNRFVHSSPSRVGKAAEIILVSNATLMLFSHIVVVIRHPRG